MNTFKLAIAQVPSVKGDVARNIATHLHAIDAAGRAGVSVLLFPELSLTGYEPELAAALAFSHDDPRLVPLVEAAKTHRIHVIAGAPLANAPLPRIGALIISPAGAVSSYAKMHLHDGEERYFSPGDTYRLLEVDGFRLAVAVCADTAHAEHVRACVAQGADAYLAGMLVSANGYAHDTAMLADYARDHGVLVAMANHNRPTGGLVAIGRSGLWSAAGTLACADEGDSTLVVARAASPGWRAELVAL